MLYIVFSYIAICTCLLIRLIRHSFIHFFLERGAYRRSPTSLKVKDIPLPPPPRPDQQSLFSDFYRDDPIFIYLFLAWRVQAILGDIYPGPKCFFCIISF